MKEKTEQLLLKAERACRSCEDLIRLDDADAAANRAYYAMFYVAEALLNEKGLEFKKHSAVHSAFGFHFAKTGLLEPLYHDRLLTAFNVRNLADYGVAPRTTREAAEDLAAQAREFLAAARVFLGIP